MTGGIGRIRAEQFWTEQVRLTPLTSDPTDSEEGELWLRGDLAEEDDQLATLRLDTGGSTVDIPVFDVAADVPDDVSTQLRLVVDGQQGFVPTVEDGGSIPQLGVWSDGARHEAIEELLAIPDSVVSRTADNDTTSSTDTTSYGMRFKSDVEWDKIGFELSENTEELNDETAELHDNDAGELIATKDVSGLSGGDTFVIDDGIESDTDYSILLNPDEGRTLGHFDGDDTPYQSEDGDITIENSVSQDPTDDSGIEAGIISIGNVGID